MLYPMSMIQIEPTTQPTTPITRIRIVLMQTKVAIPTNAMLPIIRINVLTQIVGKSSSVMARTGVATRIMTSICNVQMNTTLANVMMNTAQPGGRAAMMEDGQVPMVAAMMTITGASAMIPTVCKAGIVMDSSGTMTTTPKPCI